MDADPPAQGVNFARRITHKFKQSTRYDVIAERRLDPKAVFGVAATEALGFEVLPGHFPGGIGTPCFRALQEAGYPVVLKGHSAPSEGLPVAHEDQEWVEGQATLISHLKKERAAV